MCIAGTTESAISARINVGATISSAMAAKASQATARP